MSHWRNNSMKQRKIYPYRKWSNITTKEKRYYAKLDVMIEITEYRHSYMSIYSYLYVAVIKYPEKSI